jgi:enoyl-CoA hydratase/carnithine racemase
MVGCGQLWDGFRHHRDTEETDMADTTTMTTPATEYELRGPAAWIRLTRAKKMNAIDGDVIDGIAAGLDHASGDGARSVVLTGSGPVFCAGADLKNALQGLNDFAAIDGLLADAGVLFRRIAEHPTPVIAAVNGAAVAGGLELILACDLVIAAEEATLADGHANYGVFPGGGSSVLLPRIMGTTRAKHLIFTGRAATAREMQELGVVNEVVPREQLEDAVQSLCKTLAQRSGEMLTRAKKVMRGGSDLPLEEALDLELDACRAQLRSADAAEGLAAFSEGRRPNFTGGAA